MNRKLREGFATAKDQGPSATSGSCPVPSIANDAFRPAATPTISSGPRVQPNSSLGATRVVRGNHGIKA